MAENWIISCNLKKFDVIGAFSKLKKVNWKQNCNVNIDDVVYIYVGVPKRALLYMCRVTGINLPEIGIDDKEFFVDSSSYDNAKKYMELTLDREINIPYRVMEKCGVKGNIQGPRRAPSMLVDEMLSFKFDDNDNSPRTGWSLKEGKKVERYSTTYERNRRNREEAIKIHGTKCMACGFDFYKVYGERGQDFIEVHHVKPLSQEGEMEINPETDLICLCSNCHSMIHRKRDNVLSLQELRSLLERNR